MNREQAIDLVHKQLDHQVEKWKRPDGEWPENIHKKNTILGEEVGEVANAILEGDWDNLKIELAQVAAVCVSILMSEFKPGQFDEIPSWEKFDRITDESLAHKGGRGYYND